MLNTFRLGADIATLEEIDKHASGAIDEFASELVAAGHLAQGVDASAFKGRIIDAFRDRVNNYIFEKHGRPLRQVVGMLSPEELAEIAETFVSIESLKEQVTQPTESVGGAIDVAVISKGRRVHLDQTKALLRSGPEPSLHRQEAAGNSVRGIMDKSLAERVLERNRRPVSEHDGALANRDRIVSVQDHKSQSDSPKKSTPLASTAGKRERP